MSEIKDPSHYADQAITIQPKDICIELDFCHGNVLKYLFRAGHKEGASEVTDLKKAIEYLDIYFEKYETYEPFEFDLKEKVGWLLTFSKNQLLSSLGDNLEYDDTNDAWKLLYRYIEYRIKEIESAN